MSNRILIVEDNKVNRSILIKILHEEYEIVQAENGKEALEIIKTQHGSLSAVILDLLMPEMNGKQLLEILSKDETYSNLPILIATGEHNTELESECLKAGAWDFVTKPYHPDVIRLRLHNIIGRSQSYLMQQVQRLAERDPLTNIYNRAHFFEMTKKMLEEHQDLTFIMIRIDIDHFRLYTAAYGTDAGKRLIQQIAAGIQTDLKDNEDTICTYGHLVSDVFCICIPYQAQKLEQILSHTEKKIQNYASNYRLKATFGLYIIENTEEEVEEMYSHALDAARKCKDNLNQFFAYYTKEMGQQAAKSQVLTNEMAIALEEEQFKVYLQPKYSIETNEPCGAEALVRWMHPQWGMVSPGEFIPVFEKNGLIVQLDYYMWEHVCMLLQTWLRRGEDVYPVSVNISRISLYNPHIVEQIVELTTRYEIPHYLLNLEVTESAYMSNQDMMKNIIDSFHENGFVILMDDFGSGYSSLNTLKDIDVDILKIDMKFLPTGENNAKSEKILASVVRMAGWLGMPVVVEGVEIRQQRDFLESIGCEYVQGYYYAKPMPVADYEALLQKQRKAQLPERKEKDEFLQKFDAIWSSDSQISALLTSVYVPFAILEYSDSEIDLLRTNKAFTDLFGTQSMSHYMIHKEWYKLLTALDEIVLSKGKSECECLFILSQGESKWYQIHLIYIGTIGKTSLISTTFSDVTAQRKMEKELNMIFSAIQTTQDERESLLIVDDSEISREIIKSLFEDHYEILQAADGEEGLEILQKKSNQIAAVLLDMIMPRMDGKEFLSYKNKMSQASDIPTIVISSENDEAAQLHMLENGVNDYVTKPFVPAVVKRRLQNVMEYNSRFRTLVKEYHETNSLALQEGGRINLTGYTKEQIKSLISVMNKIFDLVRLVDPTETAVVTIEEDLSIKKVPYSCFSIWGKSVRCENCSSLCAKKGQCTLNKFELLKNDVFYVVSQPVEVQLDEKQSEILVLEIASRVTDESKPQSEEVEAIYGALQNTYGLIYIDPLTKAYNRRYLDEMLFVHHGQNKVATQVALIMLDLHKFKQINDLFGHQTGDRVLTDVVTALKTQIRQQDSVVRYGGDEFVVFLTNCEENRIEPAIERFKQALGEIHYGPGNTISVEADFGFSFADPFKQDKEILTNMIREADDLMYTNKKQHKLTN